jgi:CRP-like cAMP-binding protein
MDQRPGLSENRLTDRNRLLKALTREQADFLQDRSKNIELVPKVTLQEPGDPIDYVYFPLSGVISMVNEPNPGDIVEIGTVGREGFAGVPVLLGATSVESRAVVQVPGEAVRVRAAVFQEFLQRDSRFRALLMRYVLAFLTQVAQSASCNRLHEVQERCARWLLQTHDRVGGESFPLTQEFLAQMLGVHRQTVTIAAGMLQKAGFIQYVRGVVTILDREGLERAACNCYRIVVNEYNRLLNTEEG